MNHANKILDHLRNVIHQKTNFPIGLMAYFGPDNQTVTKIVAIVLESSDSEPVLKSWNGPGVTTEKEVAIEIGRYFKKHGTTEVVMTESVVGCPHEEGVDYPVGESCPLCPYWSDNPV